METFTISLRDVRLRGYHGVMAQERKVGNDFSVSVSLRIAAAGVAGAEAMGTDALAQTVNYAAVAEIIRSEMAVPSALLESVALRIRRAIEVSVDVEILGGRVEIVKLTPPLGLLSAGASVCLEW